jgi:hypothetical protein
MLMFRPLNRPPLPGEIYKDGDDDGSTDVLSRRRGDSTRDSLYADDAAFEPVDAEVFFKDVAADIVGQLDLPEGAEQDIIDILREHAVAPAPTEAALLEEAIARCWEATTRPSDEDLQRLFNAARKGVSDEKPLDTTEVV